jgi:hypothetical protein
MTKIVQGTKHSRRMFICSDGDSIVVSEAAARFEVRKEVSPLCGSASEC